MKRLSRARYSKCATCPLRDERRVWGEYPETGDVPIVILGEAAGTTESYQGRPFVGPAGIWLSKALQKAGILKYRCGLTNVITCRPPGNNIHSVEAMEAITACRPGFEHEVRYWKKRNVKVIIPVGNTALSALGIPHSISKARGSVFLWRDFVVVPTYHPAFIMRGQTKEEGTWIADLEKAKEIAENGWKPPAENFNIEPTLADIEEFVEDAVDKKKLIGVDIEATGLNPYHSEIVVVGLASSASDAISFPLLSGPSSRYWSSSEEPKALALLKRLLSKCPTMFQNALFDVRFLDIKGFHVGKLTEDVMLAHHAIHPELHHDLAYITSIYGKTPYWKAPFKDRNVSILRMDQKVMKTYNLRDAVVLHQILPGLVADLKELGTYNIYRKIAMPLIYPVLEMINTGMKISPSRLATWRKKLQTQLFDIEKELRETADLPDEFNFASGDHMRFLIYGIYPNQYKKAITELEQYNVPGNKKKKDTKKYRNLLRIRKVFNETRALTIPRMNIPRTLKGGVALDEEARLRIKAEVTKRLQAISRLSRKNEGHSMEETDLKRTLRVLELFGRFQEVQKLYSTYTSFPTEADGRVHFPYKIHGTATGRLASGDKKGAGVGNAQNIPPEARKLFIAENGFTFIAGDYINLELVLIGLLSNDESLLELFRTGKNAHDENTRMLFGINKKSPLWKTYRKAAKIYRFAMNYGSSIENAYRQIILNVPEFNMTLAEFRAIDAKYMELHPAYKVWYEKIKDTVLKTRMLTNGLGRVRIFLGSSHDIVKQGLDFGPQSTGADILNGALIDTYKMLHKNKMATRMIQSVHDSIMLEAPMGEVEKAEKILKKAMTRTYTINGIEWTFKAEYSIGSTWGTMEPIKL